MKLTKTVLSSLALTAVMGTAGVVQAAENPFALRDLNAGLRLAAAEDGAAAGQAKDSKCGGATGKTSEGKCGGKAMESKTTEGKCGGSK